MAKKKNKQRKIKQTTLIVVGEGQHDKAFLKHMQGIYDGRETGQKVTIDFSSGGSPHDIIKDSIKKVGHIGYDKKYIVMDSDVAINSKDLKKAKEGKFTILQSEPICLEGMLLDVLQQKIPNTAQQCKKILHPQLSGQPTEVKSYSPLFDKPVLDVTNKQTIVTLRELLQNKK